VSAANRGLGDLMAADLSGLDLVALRSTVATSGATAVWSLLVSRSSGIDVDGVDHLPGVKVNLG